MLFTYVIQIMQYFLGKEKSFYRFHVTGRESKTKEFSWRLEIWLIVKKGWLHLFWIEKQCIQSGFTPFLLLMGFIWLIAMDPEWTDFCRRPVALYEMVRGLPNLLKPQKLHFFFILLMVGMLLYCPLHIFFKPGSTRVIQKGLL